jgi:hypothetical protein
VPRDRIGRSRLWRLLLRRRRCCRRCGSSRRGRGSRGSISARGRWGCGSSQGSKHIRHNAADHASSSRVEAADEARVLTRCACASRSAGARRTCWAENKGDISSAVAGTLHTPCIVSRVFIGLVVERSMASRVVGAQGPVLLEWVTVDVADVEPNSVGSLGVVRLVGVLVLHARGRSAACRAELHGPAIM